MATNQEKIDKLNRVKQSINEGSADVRQHIDDGVIPILEPDADSKAIKIVKDARQFYNESCRNTKLMIDKTAALYKPAPPIIKLPDELTYPQTRQFISPFFYPAIFFHKGIELDDLRWFADRMARNAHGNCIRALSFGTYEPTWVANDLPQFPYLKTGNKFDCFQYDPRYWEMLKKRVEVFVERQIFVFVDIYDNCSIHNRPHGWWADHPWNGKNNVNGSSLKNTMVYHHEEPQHIIKPGVPETREIVLKWERDLWTFLYENFDPWIGVGAGNEVAARMNWHNNRAKMVREVAPNFPRWKMSTSMNSPTFYNSTVWKNWIYSIHSCCSWDKYKTQDEFIPDKTHDGNRSKDYIASQDGCWPMDTMGEVEQLVYDILQDGRIGFEQNLRPFFKKVDGQWTGVPLLQQDLTFRSMDYAYAEAVKKGWLRHLNS